MLEPITHGDANKIHFSKCRVSRVHLFTAVPLTLLNNFSARLVLSPSRVPRLLLFDIGQLHRNDGMALHKQTNVLVDEGLQFCCRSLTSLVHETS